MRNPLKKMDCKEYPLTEEVAVVQAISCFNDSQLNFFLLREHQTKAFLLRE
jgi:hypothetical protein